MINAVFRGGLLKSASLRLLLLVVSFGVCAHTPVYAESGGRETGVKRHRVKQVIKPAMRPADNAMPDEVRLVVDWILRTDQHAGRPFIVGDKTNGLLLAFRGDGELIAQAPALYGAVRTDEMTQAQADKSWKELVDADKITPAGIFPALAYQSPAYGSSIRFAEYANSNLLIHRAPAEWRRRNLQSGETAKMRVTYGCINVMPDFLDKVLLPIFNGESTVFILPEKRSAREFFAIDDSAPSKLQTAHR